MKKIFLTILALLTPLILYAASAGVPSAGVQSTGASKTYVDGKISDTAYNATSWDNVTTIAPSKNAVRDRFETIAPGGVVSNVSNAANLGGVPAANYLLKNNDTANNLTVTNSLNIPTDAVNPTDGVNLRTMQNTMGITIEYFPHASSAMSTTVTESETADTETLNATPVDTMTLFYKTTVADTPTPFTLKTGSIVNFHFGAEVDTLAAVKTVTLQARLFRVDADGTSNKTALCVISDATATLDTTKTAYELYGHVSADITVAAGSRLWVEWYANTTGAAPAYPDVSIYRDSVNDHVFWGISGGILAHFLPITGGTSYNQVANNMDMQSGTIAGSTLSVGDLLVKFNGGWAADTYFRAGASANTVVSNNATDFKAALGISSAAGNASTDFVKATGGTLSAGNLANVTFQGGVGEAVVALGTCSTAINIPFDTGSAFTLALNGACAINASNLPATGLKSATVIITQLATNAPTLGDGLKILGSIPTMTAANNIHVMSAVAANNTYGWCSISAGGAL